MPQREHSSNISSVLTDDSSTMADVEKEMDIHLLSLDQGLEPYKDHFRYRMKRYLDQKKLFENYEGGLEEFALGNAQIIVLEALYYTHTHFDVCVLVIKL